MILKKVVIIQKIKHFKTEGFLCQKQESIIDEVCGIFSYSKIVDVKIGNPVNMSIGEYLTIKQRRLTSWSKTSIYMFKY